MLRLDATPVSSDNRRLSSWSGLHPPGTTVVLPESTLGFWTSTVSRLRQAKLSGAGITVIAGAAIIDDGGYDNVLVKISPDGGGVLYRERMPVPGSMWQPWLALTGEAGGVRAHIFGEAVASVGGTKIAPLICYEQLLVWPVLQSVFHRPEAIVAVGNGWWTAGTSIIEIQRANSEAWARLFDLHLVISFNTMNHGARMLDAVLIKECADPSLKPAIIE